MSHFYVRVYYEDTDLAGIVYYANYLKFIERARSEYLRKNGINQISLRAKNLVFAVVELQCRYVRPAKFDDMLKIETRLDLMKGTSFYMLQSIFRDDVLLFKAHVRLAMMDVKGRVQRLPQELRAKFNLLNDMKSS